ncbi:hypothetical protein CAAN1_17S02058 [[Candida] anglica]|uniref:mRNA-capping enzyme subunit beta n=1 Tax=[Candida] anglica TaxID=148631 RepID=A0ABP0E7E4_9ASCO
MSRQVDSLSEKFPNLKISTIGVTGNDQIRNKKGLRGRTSTKHEGLKHSNDEFKMKYETKDISRNSSLFLTDDVHRNNKCSITGELVSVVGSDAISQWIFDQLLNISREERHQVEFELKFGRIEDKHTKRRIFSKLRSEQLIFNSSTVSFNSGMFESDWKELQTSMCDFEGLLDLCKITSSITDTMYNTRIEGKGKESVRISADNLVNPKTYNGIVKEKKSNLLVYCPTSKYDFRLTLSLERPVPQEEIKSIQNGDCSYIRHKKRTSFIHSPTITRFDITKVESKKPVRNSEGKLRMIRLPKTFEVELEIDSEILFDEIRKDGAEYKVDEVPSQIGELVESFFNNARILNEIVKKSSRERKKGSGPKRVNTQRETGR